MWHIGGGLGLLTIRSEGHPDLFCAERIRCQASTVFLVVPVQCIEPDMGPSQLSISAAHGCSSSPVPSLFFSIQNGTLCGTGGGLSHEIHPVPAPACLGSVTLLLVNQANQDRQLYTWVHLLSSH